MVNYLDNPDIREPEVEAIQPRDFSYKELRDKHPELESVSKREYANNRELQEQLEGVRLDGTSWRDDYDFDEEMNVSQLSSDSLIEKEDSFNSEQETHLSYGGDESISGTSNRLTEFKGGGTHEQNSLGGIPLGIGANGKRNSVEEGETRYEFDDGGYIFSNRIDTTGLFKDAVDAKNQYANGGKVDGPGPKKPVKFGEAKIDNLSILPESIRMASRGDVRKPTDVITIKSGINYGEKNYVRTTPTLTGLGKRTLPIEQQASDEFNMEAPKKEKYKNKSELRQQKDVDWIEKAMGIATHPFTAFGYAARNEDLPDNFEKAENTNKFDDVIGMVNPARRFKSGVDAMDDLGKGDFKKALLDAIGVVNPWSKATPVITGTGRLTRNRRVAQAAGYAASKVPLADTFTEGVTGMDFASLLEEGRKVQSKKKLKK